MSTIFNRIQAARKELADAQRELKANNRALLKQAFEKIFEKHPQAGAFQWQQYTPAFNDGDPCRFTVNEVNVSPIDDVENFSDCYGLDKEDALCTAVSDFEELLDSLGDGLLEGLFGDNVEITVSRDGIEVDEYDCGY